jgi:hypothetical protein
MAYVTVINEHAYVQQVISGHHHLTTLRRYAARNNWQLGKITVGLRWSRDAAGKEHIERRLSFAKPLESEQKAQLLQAAEDSVISGVLRPGLSIQSAVLD